MEVKLAYDGCRNYVLFAFVIFVVMILDGCSRNTITGRSQLSLVPETEVQALAITQYQSFLSSNKVVPATTKDAEMVQRVGHRIAAAIQKYYTEHGQPNALKNYHWEFNLVDSKEINAWCMPGGKVVVYTGILPVTQNETALAIVLGHEITHAVAGHGRERMSQQLLAQGIEVAGNVALSTNTRAVNLFNQVYAPTAQVGVLLPNSRKQEYEADHYGLIFAAMAGYDPREAIPFWKRMEALGGAKPPVFLSDHPADANRIQKLEALMPEALTYYHPTSGK
ncbi:M48 family metallopeptidase [Hydrotalea sp.]|uniref:M48 family metallopeptidase n=1 Tax=Hydrotalea sp. TaxID=2881279 RepID=UPI0026068B79|nr:M48 family metallopeptidase [Hydrotalea sp.]